MRILKKIVVLFFIFCFVSIFCQKYSSVGVSVLDYGAKPAKDWKMATDNYAAIQKAVDENPGRAIFIPAGKYVLSKPIKISNGVRIIGENKYSTVLQPLNCNGIEVSGESTTVENIFIYGGGKIGIIVTGVHSTTISDVILQNVNVGINLVNSWNTKISNIDIDINQAQNPKVFTGILLTGKNVNNFINTSKIAATENGILIQGGADRSEGLMLSNLMIFGSKNGINCEGILSLNITNCIIDLCTDYAIKTASTTGLMISNSWLYSIGNNKTQTLKLSSTWDSHLSANNIRTKVGSGSILLDNYTHNTIISNCTIEISNSDGAAVTLDKTTSSNIIKDCNILTNSSNNRTITTFAPSNNISDNIITVNKIVD